MLLALWQSFFFIFLAELGDKSQLVALAFATRYRPLLVVLGVFTATLIVHLFSVAFGQFVANMVPDQWIAIAAGLAFIGFGIWTLRGDKLEEGPSKTLAWGAFFTITATFFISELGDKTMLATITLATRDDSFMGVWIGSTIGMVAADAVAIGAGTVAGKRLPEKPIKIAAALIFILTGVWTLVDAFR